MGPYFFKKERKKGERERRKKENENEKERKKQKEVEKDGSVKFRVRSDKRISSISETNIIDRYKLTKK